MSLLEEMDSAFLVTTVDVPSLYRSRQIVKHLSDSGYDPAKLQLVLNRVPRRTDVTVQEVEGMMKVPVAMMTTPTISAMWPRGSVHISVM